VVVNPENLRFVRLLDDACDECPDFDGELPDYSGYGLEVYRALYAYRLHREKIDDDFEEQCSERLQAVVRDIVAERNLNDSGTLEALLDHAVIWAKDGEREAYEISDDDLYDLWLAVEQSESCPELLPRMVSLCHAGGDYESYRPLRSLAVVDAPLIPIIEKMKEVHRELGIDEDDDADSTEAFPAPLPLRKDGHPDAKLDVSQARPGAAALKVSHPTALQERPRRSPRPPGARPADVLRRFGGVERFVAELHSLFPRRKQRTLSNPHLLRTNATELARLGLTARELSDAVALVEKRHPQLLAD